MGAHVSRTRAVEAVAAQASATGCEASPPRPWLLPSAGTPLQGILTELHTRSEVTRVVSARLLCRSHDARPHASHREKSDMTEPAKSVHAYDLVFSGGILDRLRTLDPNRGKQLILM